MKKRRSYKFGPKVIMWFREYLADIPFWSRWVQYPTGPSEIFALKALLALSED